MRTRKYLILKAAFIILLALTAGLISQRIEQAIPSVAASGLQQEKIIIETADGRALPIVAEIAEKPVELQIGLMYRESMEPDHGMLFLMGKTPAVTSFWMKNTLIPLDMLFIARDGKIAHIHRNATPQSLSPVSSREEVVAVLELNGGRSDELGINIGDLVKYSYFVPSP